MTSTAPAVVARGLIKTYGKTRALDGFDLTVARGAVCALLGPNGAGKTTAVRILTTLLRPDGGSAEVAGIDVATEPALVRTRIGMIGQQTTVDDILTGRENLLLWCRLYHLSQREARTRSDQLLEHFGLTEAGDKQAKHYSGGMRRRLDLAASFVLTPQVLFLDEPTTGLDPRNRNEVWSALRGVVALGTTVLMTTQYLDEADQLADQVVVIDHGRVIADGPGRAQSHDRRGSDRCRAPGRGRSVQGRRDRRSGSRCGCRGRGPAAPGERSSSASGVGAQRGDPKPGGGPDRRRGREPAPANPRRGVPAVDRPTCR